MSGTRHCTVAVAFSVASGLQAPSARAHTPNDSPPFVQVKAPAGNENGTLFPAVTTPRSTSVPPEQSFTKRCSSPLPVLFTLPVTVTWLPWH